MSEAQPLAGRTAVVTGGGRGIGAAIAEALAAAGAAVVVTARSQDQIEELAARIEASGGRALAVTCDVADPEQVTELARRAEAFGTIDILVNNAGIAGSAPLARIALEDWNRIFTVNATGTLLCTQAFAPAMARRGWGRVVNVASVAGKAGAPYIAAYAASKHAVVGFTRAIAVEMATTGVTVNAVCPGYVETDMVAFTVDRISGKTDLDATAARATLEAMSPQKRIFGADEVAHLVLSLCHPLAAGVNGQSLVLDGGAIQS